MRIHGEDVNFKGLREWCTLCGKPKFVNYQQRKRHYNKHHRQEPPPPESVHIIDPATMERVILSGPRCRTSRKVIIQQSPPPNYAFTTPPEDAIISEYLVRLSIVTPKLHQMINNRLKQVEESVKQLPRKVRISRAAYPEMSRNQRDFPTYAALFQNLQDPKFITGRQYELLTLEASFSTQHRHEIVVTTPEGAEKILMGGGPPQRCILVPNASAPVIDEQEFQSQLRAYTAVDIQDQDALLSETKGQPSVHTGIETISMINAKRRINLLSLSSFRANPTPDCIARVPELDILTRVNRDGRAGKKLMFNPRDLSNCASWQIYGDAEVWSTMHHDHYGMVTTVFCEFGEKCWLVWPHLTDEEKEAWRRHGYGWTPPHKPTFIHMRAGDLLIMPSNTPHAPYTMTNCLMTGTQHFHSANMVVHLSSALFERSFADSTNELEAVEAIQIFHTLEDWMIRKVGRRSWPPSEEIETFSRLLDVSNCPLEVSTY